MPIRREFLDWKLPALSAAADYLLRRFGGGRELDLGRVIVVVPGARSGRRLLELLVEGAESRGEMLTPPQIVTENQLPELLYQPKLQFADALVQQLAWAAALRSFSPAQLAPLLPHPPQPHDTTRWLALAESLRRLHAELAADGLDCSHVLKGGDGVEGFAEHRRWQVLCEVQQAYLRKLDSLDLWDVQTARLVAIKQREISTENEIVLLGMVDLNRAHRQMLDQISDRVTALIVAPPSMADRFDAHGCLVPKRWTHAELPLGDEQIERAEGPADQAEAVARWMASLEGQYRADEIVVGVPDERLVPQLERQLAQAGVRTRWAIGKRLAETGPFRLLKAAARYAHARRFRDLAALVRHPDVFEWLTAKLGGEEQSAELLTALDDYACQRLPARIDDKSLKEHERAKAAWAACQHVGELVAPLVGNARPLAEWAEGLRSVLAEVYGDRELDRTREADRYTLGALVQLREAIGGLQNVPKGLQPRVDARLAAQLVLSSLAAAGIAPPVDRSAVELLGWLELPLDDAPALVVTTCNEGFVPSSSCADAYLPNRLRCQLGLLDDDRRLARDAYSLSVLLASRKELRLIVGRRDAEGSPLVPSRLLFAADEETIVRRARWLFAHDEAAPPRHRPFHPTPPERTTIERPRPKPLEQPIAAFNVTQLRDYIACPYRYYLRHVLKLQEQSDEAPELDGGAFGALIHSVLEEFGRSEDARVVREATDERLIAAYLEQQLACLAAARFGEYARPAVRVQIEQARLRLRSFAKWQAQRTADGWRIVFSEDSKRVLTITRQVGEQKVELRGRIDRIDYHDQMRRLCVLDYKTADAGLPPETTHRKADKWIDLQLPLYRHLVRSASLSVTLPSDIPIDLGYVLLPKDAASVGLALADWDEALLQSADSRADEIFLAILSGKFWPPASPPPDFADDLAVICQDHRMGSWKLNREETP